MIGKILFGIVGFVFVVFLVWWVGGIRGGDK